MTYKQDARLHGRIHSKVFEATAMVNSSSVDLRSQQRISRSNSMSDVSIRHSVHEVTRQRKSRYNTTSRCALHDIPFDNSEPFTDTRHRVHELLHATTEVEILCQTIRAIVSHHFLSNLPTRVGARKDEHFDQYCLLALSNLLATLLTSISALSGMYLLPVENL
jgi:hypothetical protein